MSTTLEEMRARSINPHPFEAYFPEDERAEIEQWVAEGKVVPGALNCRVCGEPKEEKRHG